MFGEVLTIVSYTSLAGFTYISFTVSFSSSGKCLAKSGCLRISRNVIRFSGFV